MDTNTILLKSPRGREEIRTREHGLPRLARRLLIMADGQLTVKDLAADLACDPRDRELQEALDRLVEGRYLLVADAFDERKRARRPARGWHAVA